MLNIEIILKEQEQEEGVPKENFARDVAATKVIVEAFGSLTEAVVFATLEKIINERVNSESGADYIQIVTIGEVSFWVIDDGSVVTFLFPEEY